MGVSERPHGLQLDVSGIFFLVVDRNDKNGKECFSLTGEILPETAETIRQTEIEYRLTEKEKSEAKDFGNILYITGEEKEALRGFIEDYREVFSSGSKREESAVEKLLRSYFNLLLLFLTGAEREASSPYMYAGYLRILEELLFVNCIRERSQNKYLVPPNHPIVLMHRLEEEKNKEYLGVDKAETEHCILKTILDVKGQNKSRFKMFSRNQVYETVPGRENKAIEAKLFRDIETNTPISDIRILEKIFNYKKNHEELSAGQGPQILRIACFGEMEETEELRTLCQGIDIRIFKFRREASLGKYYFSCENSENLKESYDLLNASDISELYARYQMVLLLDMNCFYRQNQREKTPEEKNEVRNCSWYLGLADSAERIQDKAVFYQLIYEHIGMWVNSAYTDLSAAYEFDEKLYLSLLNAYKENTDVYLYIKHGDKIAGRDLRFNNICNDEYYNGKELIVSKLSKNTDINAECRKFLDIELDNTVDVNCWKILKSINNEFCQQTLKNLAKSQKNRSIADAIRQCKESFIVFDYSEAFDKKRSIIKYGLCLGNTICCEESKAILMKMMETVIKYVRGGKDNKPACVKAYFRNLLMHSVISNANNFSDLLFAYVFSKGYFNGCEWEKGDEAGEETYAKEPFSNGFKLKKTLFSVIERLAAIQLGKVEDREIYFTYTFRKDICPELEEDIFREVLKAVEKSCQRIGYTESMLYQNSILR